MYIIQTMILSINHIHIHLQVKAKQTIIVKAMVKAQKKNVLIFSYLFSPHATQLENVKEGYQPA